MKLPTPDTAAENERGFTFGNFRLEPDGSLLLGGKPVHVPPKEMAALQLLLERAGQIVTPVQLREALWGELHVTADSVPRCISSLRACLGSEECIQTVYKRGYRLTWPVQRDYGAHAWNLPRLAIVPFALDRNVPEHLGRAVAEEATARLTAVRPPLFSMLARDSVFTLAGKGMSAQQVGQTLRADLVLAGTLHALPAHLRLRVEMIRIRDGTQIWVEDMMVARERAAGLELELVDRLTFRAGGGLSLAAAADDNPVFDAEAYEIFLRGRYEWQSLERHRMQDGMRLLRRAAELEPKLAQARLDLVHALLTQELLGFLSPAEAAQQVRSTVEAMPPDAEQSAQMLPALGWMAFHVDHDLASALRMVSPAPHAPFTPWRVRMEAMLAASRHRFDELCRLLQQAREADAFSPWVNAELAWAYHLSSRRDEALRQVERCLELDPDHFATRLYGGMILAFQGDVTRATGLTRQLARSLPYCDIAMAAHAYSLACDGQRERAGELLEGLQWLSRERFVLRSFSAAAYVALGDADGAMEELRAAEENHCPWFFAMLADPRLQLLERISEFEQMRARLAAMEEIAAQGVRNENGGLGTARDKSKRID
ncbi:MAG TPA: winged helix-turn-helix domain-containing protein [Terracidiphilus sp.]|jgi:DNA-binding winged helix-turn-helix (wHTH) protein/tetratricopeptide (TPR) repeat protein|nr:winged helix-turn-helix domain-containing protein [Terracidiphilus sp.]